MIRKLLLVAPVLTILYSCSRPLGEKHVNLNRRAPVQVTMERQVLNAIDAGEGDIVARKLRERMNADPNNLDTRLELAAHYSAQGFPEVAIEHYRLLRDRFPDDERVVLRLAEALSAQKQDEAAAKEIEKFLATHPPRTAALTSQLGMVRDQAGNWQSGESAHRAALAIEPNAPKLHNNLGYNLMRQGKRADAIAELRIALTSDTMSEKAHNNIAAALARGSNEERVEAIQHWRVISDEASAHNNLGAVLIEMGQYPEARKELQTALSYRKDLMPAYYNLKLVSELEGSDVQLQGLTPQKPRKIGFAKKVWYVVVGNEQKPPAAATATGSE